jgi:hypothetical protein
MHSIAIKAFVSVSFSVDTRGGLAYTYRPCSVDVLSCILGLFCRVFIKMEDSRPIVSWPNRSI